MSRTTASLGGPAGFRRVPAPQQTPRYCVTRLYRALPPSDDHRTSHRLGLEAHSPGGRGSYSPPVVAQFVHLSAILTIHPYKEQPFLGPRAAPGRTTMSPLAKAG